MNRFVVRFETEKNCCETREPLERDDNRAPTKLISLPRAALFTLFLEYFKNSKRKEKRENFQFFEIIFYIRKTFQKKKKKNSVI